MTLFGMIHSALLQLAEAAAELAEALLLVQPRAAQALERLA
jgi:hypothetical protein